MHFAKLTTSPRLQRVRNFLKDGKKHSTREIIERAKVCAVNSIVSELRANGMHIECERKADCWYYWLTA